MTCSTCDREATCRGMCKRCYTRWRATRSDAPRCAGPECDRAALNRGLCNTHANQRDKGLELTVVGSTIPTKIVQPECSSPWCDRTQSCRGVCKRCYQSLLAHGEVRPPRKRVEKKPSKATTARKAKPVPPKPPKPQQAPQLPVEPYVPGTIWRTTDKVDRRKRVVGEGGSNFHTGMPPGYATVLDPETAAKVRRTLLSHGGDDLLEMLGVA